MHLLPSWKLLKIKKFFSSVFFELPFPCVLFSEKNLTTERCKSFNHRVHRDVLSFKMILVSFLLVSIRNFYFLLFTSLK